MQVECPIPVLTASRSIHLSKAVSPSKVKPSVSAASIFKPQPRGAAKAAKALTTITNDALVTVENSRVKKARKNEASPSNSLGKWKLAPMKNGDRHPLAVAFRGTTNAYRTQLYEFVTTSITSKHESLHQALYDSTVHSAFGPDPGDAGGSPLKLSLSYRLRQVIAPLTVPMGDFGLQYHATNKETGQSELTKYSLRERMTDFMNTLRQQEAEIIQLQAEWEAILGEIWKLGAQVLGENLMRELLIPRTSPEPQKERFSVPAGGDEEMQVVGESSKVVRPKKKVSFKEPIPKFLTKTSMYPHSVLPLPNIPKEGMKELEEKVDDLGSTNIAELKKLEKDQQEFWTRKHRQIATALGQE
ncbi:uncharacterized protein BDR25DRAFT_376655 [Lindgomyces ingoldianus]|uniref:Uncharacterized protein n=1 Tax=Lindgomyces ingoldianus TaxID=673940 RepID=A0ACB6QJ68_9PLEO|nr:uncharacterized protein BDR25DRAFT_376655 [Lindgomyces ingoldianus]KAF2467038.1 hypothetical protein BDR25DRAFT_376655 [Lindgomyces ingoldianus]